MKKADEIKVVPRDPGSRTRVLAVIGYNNTRIADVRKIRHLAHKYQAKLLLVKKNPTADDRAAADFVFDVNLDDHVNGVSACRAAANDQDLHVLAVLPFSDRGILIGAQWAAQLCLPGGDPQTITAGLDKHVFRRIETDCQTLPAWYYRPFCSEVTTLQDILSNLSRATRFGKGVYVKPKMEGNSRGGTHVTDALSAARAFEAVEAYLREGAVAEEYMTGVSSDFGCEFSSDFAGSMSWITAKETTLGLYRAEIQQIVPAALAERDYNRLREAGRAVAEFCGAAPGSACHIEGMLLEATDPRPLQGAQAHDVGTVEPNLRPAGMKIWELAETAFGRSPWEEWLAWATGRKTDHAPLERQCYAGIRMISAPCSGRFLEVPEEAVSRVRAEFEEVFDVRITCPTGKVVTPEPRDNAEFVGEVMAKHHDAGRLQSILRAATDFLCRHTRIEP